MLFECINEKLNPLVDAMLFTIARTKALNIEQIGEQFYYTVDLFQRQWS